MKCHQDNGSFSKLAQEIDKFCFLRLEGGEPQFSPHSEFPQELAIAEITISPGALIFPCHSISMRLLMTWQLACLKPA